MHIYFNFTHSIQHAVIKYPVNIEIKLLLKKKKKNAK